MLHGDDSDISKRRLIYQIGDLGKPKPALCGDSQDYLLFHNIDTQTQPFPLLAATTLHGLASITSLYPGLTVDLSHQLCIDSYFHRLRPLLP